MALEGMDIGQVRALATQMNRAAGEIQQLTQQLSGSLHNTPWVGPDQQRFLSDWQSQHVTQLNNVAQALQQAAQLANQNALQQEQASGS